MDREIAKNIIDDNTSKKSKRVVVDMIYDDFESRTCENCRYGDGDTEGTMICRHIDDAMPFHVPIDFGCNKWEGRSNG